MSPALSNYEALLALSTSPHMTDVMRGYLMAVLGEHRHMVAVLKEIVAMTNEDSGTFRKRGGTYRGLVSIAAERVLAKVEAIA